MRLIQLENTKLVQIDAEAANDKQILVDSRMYCRDVIQVEHRTWLRDTLIPNQDFFEQEGFGSIRFETESSVTLSQVSSMEFQTPSNAMLSQRQQDASILRHNPKPEKYALLTEDQVCLALTFSRNSEQVKRQKAVLVREIMQARKWQREQLERSLSVKPQDTTELDALKAENEKLEQQNQEKDVFLKEVIVSIDAAIEEHRLLKNENNKLKEELKEQKDDTKYFFEKAEKLEVPLRKAQKEIEKLKEDFDTAWKYVEHYKQQSDTYEQLAKRAIQQRNALKAENDKLKSASELEEVSPDIKIRRAYWAELITTYAENQKLREQLGMPPLSAESRKSKKTKK